MLARLFRSVRRRAVALLRDDKTMPVERILSFRMNE
jgi:hypothetical protein